MGQGNRYAIWAVDLEEEFGLAHIPDGVLSLADVKRASQALASNASASAWDLGDGVLCLEFHSKMNAMDPDILAMIGSSE